VIETWATVCVVTAIAVAAKVVEVDPAATLIEAGTVRLPLSLATSMDIPPDGATDVRVAVQDAVDAPLSVAGVQETELNWGVGGWRVTVDRTVIPEAVALTVTDWLVVTVPAVAVKLAVVDPAATATDAGTFRRLLDELMATDKLVVDALVNVTTQFEELPDASVDGEHVSDDNPADATKLMLVVTDDGATVRAPLEVEFNEALTCAVESVVNEPTCAVKLAEALPLRIVSVEGTVTREELLAR
jgi:hypothetical protein